MIRLQKILTEKYALSDPQILTKFETRGVRSAFLVESQNIKYVFKIMPYLPINKLLFSAQEIICANGFPCPKIFPNVESLLTSNDNKHQYVLTEYINGKESFPSDDNFFELGVIAGKLHALDSKIVNLPKYDLSHEIARIEKSLDTCEGINKNDKSEILNALKARSDFANSTNTLIHRDLSFFNIIQAPDKSVLIDFDNLSIGLPVFDIAHVISFSCCLIPWDYEKYPSITDTGKLTFYPDWLRHFISGYTSVRAISDLDYENIYSASLLSCIFNIFDRESNEYISWNLKRYYEIKSKHDSIIAILKSVSS